LVLTLLGVHTREGPMVEVDPGHLDFRTIQAFPKELGVPLS
jgi:hypothetical protein